MRKPNKRGSLVSVPRSHVAYSEWLMCILLREREIHFHQSVTAAVTPSSLTYHVMQKRLDGYSPAVVVMVRVVGLKMLCDPRYRYRQSSRFQGSRNWAQSEILGTAMWREGPSGLRR